MSKCALGPRKVKQLERLTGRKIISAWVRGGWDHNLVEVWFEGFKCEITSDMPPMVNRKTGEITWRSRSELD